MSFRSLRRAILSANKQPLAIEARRADTLMALGAQIARGARVSDDLIAGACGTDGMTTLALRLSTPLFVPHANGGMVAVLSFRGLVNYEIEFQPYAVSTKNFARTMGELAAAGTVKSIVIVFNSPGGMVIGTPEAANALFAARQAKKVTAVVDTMAASAAYWVASQASEITSLRSGEGVGSIGVRMTHVECSKALEADGIKVTYIYSGKFKTEGNPTEPLTDAAQAYYQMESDAIMSDFVKAVARGRGVSASTVREKFGEGRLLMPQEAKALGMIDRVEETDIALGRAGLAPVSTTSTRTTDLHAIFREALRQQLTCRKLELARAQFDEVLREDDEQERRLRAKRLI